MGEKMSLFDLFERALAEKLGISLEDYQTKVEELSDDNFKKFCELCLEKAEYEKAVDILYGRE